MDEKNQRRFSRREIDDLRQVSHNDEDLVFLLYEEYVDLVYCYFYSQFKDRSGTEKVRDVEKLTQETFMRVIEVVGQRLSPWGNRPFALWLYSIMCNVLREHVVQQNQESSNSREDNSPAYSEQEDRQENTLWGLVRELPGPEQQILILLHAWKLSYRDLATYLKRDEASCRELHTRAMRKLQQLVRKKDPQTFGIE